MQIFHIFYVKKSQKFSHDHKFQDFCEKLALMPVIPRMVQMVHKFLWLYQGRWGNHEEYR